jgi:hypothetical protein
VNTDDCLSDDSASCEKRLVNDLRMGEQGSELDRIVVCGS